MKRFLIRFQSGLLIYVLLSTLALGAGMLGSTLLSAYLRQRLDAEIVSHLRTEAAEFDARHQSLNTLLTMGYQRLRTQKIVNTVNDLTDADRYVMYLSRQALSDVAVTFANSSAVPASDFLFYFTQTGVSVTPATVYTRDNLCSLYFGVEESTLLTLLDEFLSSGYSQLIRQLQGSEQTFTLFMRRFTLTGSKEYIVGIGVLTEEMFRFDTLYDGRVYIATVDDQVFGVEEALPHYAELSQGDGDFGADHVLSVSAGAGYRLAIAVSQTDYVRPLRWARALMMGLMCVLDAAACLMLYNARKRYNRRIHHIGALLRLEDRVASGNDRLDFEELCSGLNHLIHQNDELRLENEQVRRQVESNFSLMRNSFVRMLIIGKVPEGDLSSMLTFYRISNSHERYRVLLLQIDSKGLTPEEAESARQILLVSISSSMDCEMESCMIDDYTVGCLFLYDAEDTQALLGRIRRHAEHLVEVMREKLNVHVSMGLGRSVRSIGNCLFAYHSARMVLLCNSRSDLKSLNLSGSLSDPDNERLMHILHALEQGDSAQCLSLFDGTFHTDEDGNYTEGQRTCAIVLLNLFDDTVNGNAQLTKLFAKDDLLGQQLSGCITLNEILAVLRSLLERACACVRDTSEDHAKLFVNRAAQIIQQRYADCNLSQTLIADELAVNPTTLSTKFKEVVGVGMSLYLRNLRMEHTRQLLSTTSLPLADIAERTGFGSLKTMYRVFKAETGLTPGQYRDLSAAETV